MLFENFDFKKKNGIKPEKIDASHNVCSIGFSEKEKSWWGWSHRACFGFKVGSKVKAGDSGFVPSNKEEFITGLKDWHSERKTATYEETPKGVKVTYKVGKEKQTSVEPYPAKWGKGAWTAKTLKDAKQMAIDFANSVS